MRFTFLIAALFAFPTFNDADLEVTSSEPVFVEQLESMPFEQFELDLSPVDLDEDAQCIPAPASVQRVDPRTVAELHPSELRPSWTWPTADQRLDRAFAGKHSRQPAIRA